MSAEKLRDELRSAKTPYLGQRRSTAVLALSAAAAMGVITLYQIGILKRLPGPRNKWLNAEKINGSLDAYALLRTPDAALGLGSYAATVALVSMGPSDRSKTMPWVPIALGAKSLLDAGYAGKLSIKQWTKFRAFSVWSLIAAAATMAILRFTLPEAAAAIRTLRKP